MNPLHNVGVSVDLHKRVAALLTHSKPACIAMEQAADMYLQVTQRDNVVTKIIAAAWRHFLEHGDVIGNDIAADYHGIYNATDEDAKRVKESILAITDKRTVSGVSIDSIIKKFTLYSKIAYIQTKHNELSIRLSSGAIELEEYLADTQKIAATTQTQQADFINFKDGIRFSETRKRLGAEGLKVRRELTSGVPHLDQSGCRPIRKNVDGYLCPATGGKTAHVCKCAVDNAKNGKSVVIISTEGDSAVISDRIVQMVEGFGLTRDAVSRAVVVTDEFGYPTGFTMEQTTPNKTIEDYTEEEEKTVNEKLAQLGIYIYTVPNHTLTDLTIINMLEKHKLKYGEIDIVILDYLKNMKFSDNHDIGKDKKIADYYVAAFKNVAQMFNCAFMFMHQIVVQHDTFKRMNSGGHLSWLTDAAFSRSFLEHLDNAVTFNASVDEKKAGLTRAYIEKLKSGLPESDPESTICFLSIFKLNQVAFESFKMRTGENVEPTGA